MSELPEGMAPAEVVRPRESASAIVLRRGRAGRLEVLLGVRSRRSRFMPGHHAFPGGRVEPADLPERPAGHLRAVIRELEEEVGIAIPEGAWHAAGERVTPPLYPVRFHTRFFAAMWPELADEYDPADGENERLSVVDPRAALAEWERGEIDVPPPVLPILRTLAGVADRSIEDVARAVAEANAAEERAPRIEFVPGVWMLPVRSATLPPATHTNVWIPGGRRFVVVDPGSGEREEIERLLAVVERRKQHGGLPAAVLLTHHHRDHTAGAAATAGALGVPLRAHPRVLEAIGAARAGVSCAPLEDGDTLDLGGRSIRAHACPGHASGHLAFHLPDEGVLIAGDMVSGLSTILIDPEHGDMDAYLDSLARLAGLGCRLLLPGHGPPLPGRELERVIEHRGRREARVLDALDPAAARELAEVAASAYSDSVGLPEPLLHGQTLAHLIRLERRGHARRDDPAGRRWRGAAQDAAARLRTVLEHTFRPIHLVVADESARHRGHPGASAGGGHFRVTIVSAAFEGKTRIEQHRLVNQALAGRFDSEIHALALETRAPEEWGRGRA